MKFLIKNIILYVFSFIFVFIIDKVYSGEFESSPISAEIEQRIKGKSYKENSPVALKDLRYLTISYIDFEGKEHLGEMIVNKEVSKEVLEIFEELYDEKFPIARMELIDNFDANDNKSMSANNTSALCVRTMTSNKSKFSNHSYGLAIDINPIQNPYVMGEIIEPMEGKAYINRAVYKKGMITEKAKEAFISRGWIWGGDWTSLKDYQHFEKIKIK